MVVLLHDGYCAMQCRSTALLVLVALAIQAVERWMQVQTRPTVAPMLPQLLGPALEPLKLQVNFNLKSSGCLEGCKSALQCGGNIMKPALSRGDLQALERRFQPVTVPEPTVNCAHVNCAHVHACKLAMMIRALVAGLTVTAT
eukprot:1244008-Amphidinium_carterae.1